MSYTGELHWLDTIRLNFFTMYYTDITMPSLNVSDSTSLKIHTVLTFLIKFSVVHIFIEPQYFSDRIENAIPEITWSIVLTHGMVWNLIINFAKVLINNTPVEMEGSHI